jgi:hypothetical protein
MELDNENNNRWDAENYHRVSTVQESWAIELLEKRKTMMQNMKIRA